MKAFAYLRVSGRGQIDGDGFPRQRKAIQDYAEARGIRISEWFEERGVSGKLDHRPALQRMMTALHTNGIRLVLIEKLDRLARDLMIQESIIADLHRRGFEIISATEPELCATDATRVLMRQMIGAFAQYERTMIVAKLAAARQRARAKRGHCEGRKPFGARPSEPETIARIQELRAQGFTLTAIAQMLQAERRSSRTGSPWYATQVARVLARGTRDTLQGCR